MSLGKMQTTIAICTRAKTIDADGFPSYTETTLATVRAYMEEKNMSEKWRSSSVFSEADVLFCFRFIPNLTLTTANYIKIGTDRFDITSVENVRQRKMYYEVLAKHMEESDG